jgi:hypothetical protein
MTVTFNLQVKLVLVKLLFKILSIEELELML